MRLSKGWRGTSMATRVEHVRPRVERMPPGSGHYALHEPRTFGRWGVAVVFACFVLFALGAWWAR